MGAALAGAGRGAARLPAARGGAAQPMGAAGGGAGRGVGPLAAARWPPCPFGPGGGSAEPSAPTLRLPAPAPRRPPAAPPP